MVNTEEQLTTEKIVSEETVTEQVVEEIPEISEDIIEESVSKEEVEETSEYLVIQEDGSNLVFEKVLSETNLYTRYQISYTSEGFTISGVMNIPKWDGNFPLLILNHGYIDPTVYTLGRGLKREQDYFANNWFAVLHTDYRNHAFSDYDAGLNGTGSILRSKKYGADAINAILAVQKAKQEWAPELTYVESENVGMLGHSMGWWVTMYALVSQTDLINAAVLYAPVHSNEFYNFQRWTKNRLTSGEIQELNTIYGDTEEPNNLLSISPENYFTNISTPIQMYFGTNDESCPIEWWYEIESALTDAWKFIDFKVYDGERHEFWAEWNNFMNSSSDFFQTHISTN